MQFAKRTLAAVLAVYIFAAAAIAVDGLSDKIFVSDLIIVLGNSIEANGQPSQRLQARLDRALELFRQGNAPQIFVSGGLGKEGFDEANVMADYLKDQGVPNSSIIRDSQGVDTAATAVNASRYMKMHRLHSAIAVSQFFHISRVKLALRRTGVQKIGSSHARFSEPRDFYSLAREVIAYPVYYSTCCMTNIERQPPITWPIDVTGEAIGTLPWRQ